MAKIGLEDLNGSADIAIGDGSLVAGSLTQISSATVRIVAELPHRIGDANFQSATLSAGYQSPKIALDAAMSLTMKAGANCTLTRYTAKDQALLGMDPTVPEIDIGQDDYWLSFALQTTLELGGADALGSGFGVSLKFGSALKLTGYSLFSPAAGALPTLGEAIGATLTDFGLCVSASDIRRQKPGTARASDISGTVTVSGSYSLPMAVNQLALAEALVPFKFSVNPALSVKVGGSVALTGDFSVLCWRASKTQAVLALMKKQGTTLTATFNAGAGLGAAVGGGDLIEDFFNAVAPGIDLATSGILKGDARYKAINGVLTDSVSRAFSISVNGACAATFSDQAALVYAIDLPEEADGARTAATDAALDAALSGDWSQLNTLRDAQERLNVTATTSEDKFTLSVNLLGLFNYESMADFVSDSKIVYDAENASITIADTHTARRITTASTSYLADADKLRKVLYEATLATAAYKLASGKFAADFKMNQSMLISRARLSTADLRKALRLAVLIGEATSAQLDAIPMAKPSHVRIEASQDLLNDQLLGIFLADPKHGTPHAVSEVTHLGRRTLAALLDPANPVDARRIEVLNSDSLWQDMDASGGKPPAGSPDSYDDWYDVTFWANDIHDVARPLQAVLEALPQVPAGSDPAQDKNFMKKRDILRKAIGEMADHTHAAFEMGWPIAVMFALSGGNTGATLKATWNGTPHLPLPGAVFSPPVASAKTLATGSASRD